MEAAGKPTRNELPQEVKPRGCVEFPKSEPFPRTIDEALAMGWERTDVDSTFSENLRVETGTVRYDKEFEAVDGIYVKIPFRAEYSYGRASGLGEPPDPPRKV